MDSSPPSEMDYTKRMTTNNNRMDIEILNPKTSGPHMGFPIKMPQLTPDHNEVVSNTSMQPNLPTVIPYNTNIPADLNLWNGHFGPISLFSTNKYLLVLE